MTGPLEHGSAEEIEIRLLLEALYLRYHYDFRSYSLGSIKRRLRQAREQMGFASFSAMQESVLHDATMLPHLLRYLTVQVSDMFRDPSYFRAIREHVVPHLRTYPSLKVWIAGCSSGEELYSMNNRHKAKVRADGSLIGNDVKGSIHQVGAALEGAPSCNGWTYWHYRREGRMIPIDILRQQIRAEMEGEVSRPN